MMYFCLIYLCLTNITVPVFILVEKYLPKLSKKNRFRVWWNKYLSSDETKNSGYY